MAFFPFDDRTAIAPGMKADPLRRITFHQSAVPRRLLIRLTATGYRAEPSAGVTPCACRSPHSTWNFMPISAIITRVFGTTCHRLCASFGQQTTVQSERQYGPSQRCWVHDASDHFAYDPVQNGWAVTPLLHLTSTFAFDSVEHGSANFSGEKFGHSYSRISNPTLDLPEQRCASLEGAEAGPALASGMGAISAVLWTLVSRRRDRDGYDALRLHVRVPASPPEQVRGEDYARRYDGTMARSAPLSTRKRASCISRCPPIRI